MTQHHRPRSNARGFTILEALIALLVLSFGMLAIAGFQTTLSRSADLAKQRTEAMRLAQQKMETLRAYGQVATDPTLPPAHRFNYTDDVVSSTVLPYTGPEIVSSNATFSRTWTVTPNLADTERWINVVVAWNDRAGQAQTVQLLSVISKFDPQSVGTLATGAGTSNVRRPKNRNINIPYPAVTLSGGTQSAFIPPPGNVAYVFDNTTGNIVQSCTGLVATSPTPRAVQNLTSTGTTVTAYSTGHTFVAGNSVTIAGTGNADFNGTFTVIGPVTAGAFNYSLPSVPTTNVGSGGTATLYATLLVEGLDLAASTAVCTTFTVPGYFLTGYVRFDTSSSPTGEEPNNPGSTNDTRPLDATAPFSLDTSNQPTTNGTPAMTCYAQRQQVVATNNLTPASITSLSLSGSTVTVTAPAHGFAVGTTLAINGTSPPAFIGAFVVTNVPTVNMFTYTLPPPLPTTTSATGGAAVRVQRLTIQEGTSVSGYTTLQSKFVSYACVVIPVNHDLLPSTPNRWWGRVTLNANSNSANGPTWTIGTANTNFKVCRFSADYNGNGAIANSEHPLWYRGVIGALDGQNYLVIDQSQSCPTERPADPFSNQAARYSDDTTAQHQPATAVRSFQCPSGGCSGPLPTPLEPSTLATDLTMD